MAVNPVNSVSVCNNICGDEFKITKPVPFSWKRDITSGWIKCEKFEKCYEQMLMDEIFMVATDICALLNRLWSQSNCGDICHDKLQKSESWQAQSLQIENIITAQGKEERNSCWQNGVAGPRNLTAENLTGEASQVQIHLINPHSKASAVDAPAVCQV